MESTAKKNGFPSSFFSLFSWVLTCAASSPPFPLPSGATAYESSGNSGVSPVGPNPNSQPSEVHVGRQNDPPLTVNVEANARGQDYKVGSMIQVREPAAARRGGRSDANGSTSDISWN